MLSVLAVALLLALAWARWFPVPLPLTVDRQHRMLLAYAVVQVAHVLAIRWGVPNANAGALLVGAALFAWWAAHIQPPGVVAKLTEGPEAVEVRAEVERELQALRRARRR